MKALPLLLMTFAFAVTPVGSVAQQSIEAPSESPCRRSSEHDQSASFTRLRTPSTNPSSERPLQRKPPVPDPVSKNTIEAADGRLCRGGTLCDWNEYQRAALHHPGRRRFFI